MTLYSSCLIDAKQLWLSHTVRPIALFVLATVGYTQQCRHHFLPLMIHLHDMLAEARMCCRCFPCTEFMILGSCHGMQHGL